MKCAYCKYNDGVVYTSNPPKYRCAVTSEYHLALDDCNVDFAHVVRCQDCKHYNAIFFKDGKDLNGCDVFDWASEPTDYCSFGERREPAVPTYTITYGDDSPITEL